MAQLIVLRAEAPVAFLADACDALAEAVNRIRSSSPADQRLMEVYAETVRAWALVERRRLVFVSDASTQLAIVDHLLERLSQAQAGDTALPVVDIVDRLHAELALNLRPA